MDDTADSAAPDPSEDAEDPDAADNDPDVHGDDGDPISAQVEEPAKVMRIGTMIKQLLEEVRAAPLDEAGRARLREIHETSIRELESGLAPELREELLRVSLPFGSETPSEAELRIAQAGLVGWLEGVFHGIQTALMAQQMEARQQLEQMRRRQLPGGHDDGQQMIIGPGGQMIGPPGSQFGGGDRDPDSDGGRGTGQYL